MDKPNISSLNEYTTLGNKYYYQQKYEKALDKYINALKVSQAINNREGMAICYNNIGLVLQKLGKYRKAIQYFQKALVISTYMNDTREMIVHLQNLAINYIYIEEYSMSKEYIKKAFRILNQIDNPISKSMFSNLLGVIHYKNQQYDTALEKYLDSIELNPLNSYAHYNLACTNSIQNNFEDALKHLQRAISLNPQYKETALIEKDFNTMRNLKRFKKLINEEN